MSYFYETVFITRQDLSVAQNEALAKEMTAIVEKNGGKVAKTEYWGLRTLAYKINKNRKGHYTLFHIEGPAKAKDELERNLRLHEDALRFMSIKMDALPKGETIMMKKQGEAA